ncbi:MAG: sigma-54 dependent transcriptional regulator [Kiritimatiellales bacterium]
MQSILIVDDDAFFRKVITKLLTGHGYEITVALSGEEALQILQTRTFDLMISDVNMTPMNGIELLKKSRESYPSMGVIMLTGHDEIEVAVDAMKKGAFDFLVKPFQLNDLFLTVQRSLGCYSASPENKPIEARLNMLDGLVAESSGMRKVCDVIRRIAPANVAVLLCGEAGTDKELVARALHYYSPRKDAPFVIFDCSGSPAKMDMTLFGRVKGGTLFFDNIDAMPPDEQTKLLDIIQTSKIIKNGDPGPVPIDVRIIIASSEKLELLVEQGMFCENLYYRISALRIDIPPLRNRPEDIPLLIDQALYRNLGPDAKLPVFDPHAKEILYNYIWPGNSSELEAVIRHTLSLAKNGVITREMLPEEIVATFEEGVRSHTIVDHREQFKGLAFKAFLKEKQEKLLGRSADRRESPDQPVEPEESPGQSIAPLDGEKKGRPDLKWI